MSTKIYNGYYSNLKLAPLLVKLKSNVNDFKTLKEIGYAEYLSGETAKRIDRKQSIDNNSTHLDILIDNNKNHIEEIKKTKKSNIRLFGTYDFSASCCLFPIGNKTLILFYSDNDKVLKLWESLDYIYDYHYQNQCDSPEDITTRQWNIRKKNWNIVLGGNGYGIPSENGYTFTLSHIDLPHLYEIKTLLKIFMISDDDRAKEIIYNETYNKIYEEKKKECENQNRSIGSLLGMVYINSRDSFDELKNSDSFKDKLDETKKTLVSINFDKK